MTHRYIRVAADYESPALSDAGAPLEFGDLGLSSELVAAILRWNGDYQWVIPLTTEERAERRQQIEGLDAEGLMLCERIAEEAAWEGGAPQVQYYSEGELRLLRWS